MSGLSNIFCVDKIRDYFPILKSDLAPHKKSLVYLDSAASCLKPIQVLEKEKALFYGYYGNVHRSSHWMANMATEAFEASRSLVVDLLGAQKRSEIIFTKGATEAINLVAFGLGRILFKPGSEIILSAMEHHSNMVPWQLLAKEQGLKIKYLEVDASGNLLIEGLEKLITERTCLISLTHVSNVLGTINDICAVTKLAHKYGIPVLVDGAQAAGHIQVNVVDLGVDFYVFSGHKLYGPNGVGVLYGKEEWLERLPPYQSGGEMIASVSLEGSTFNELPYKFEAGTPNISGVIGLGASIKLLNTIGLNEIYLWEHVLLQQATELLKLVDGIKIVGTSLSKSAIISFCVEDVHAYDVCMLLDQYGIACRSGNLCAEPIVKQLGSAGGVCRISFGMYNTSAEVVYFVECLKLVLSRLKKR